MTEFLSDLSRSHKYAEGLQRLVSDAMAGVSRRVEASDRAYVAVVVLASDGTVDAIRIDADWKRKARADKIGAAVMEAYAAASTQQYGAWAKALAESQWEARAEQLRARIDAEPVAESEPVPDYPSDLSRLRPRDSGAIVAEVNAVLDSLGDLTELPAPVTGTGTAGFGKVVVTVTTNGLVSCTVDGMWAEQRTGDEITEAFGAALAAAKADLTEALAKSPAGRLNGLLDQALANLHNARG